MRTITVLVDPKSDQDAILAQIPEEIESGDRVVVRQDPFGEGFVNFFAGSFNVDTRPGVSMSGIVNAVLFMKPNAA